MSKRQDNSKSYCPRANCGKELTRHHDRLFSFWCNGCKTTWRIEAVGDNSV